MNAASARDPLSSFPPPEESSVQKRAAGDEAGPRKKRLRKEEIVAEATKLFAERGYEGTSMGDLAERVGLRKASLFHHFESKDALYASVLSSLIEGIGTAVSASLVPEGTFEVRLNALTGAVTAMLAAQPHAARLLAREAMDGGRNGPAIQAQLADRVREVLGRAVAFVEGGQRDGVVRPDVDAKHVVISVVGMYFVPFLIDRSVAEVVGHSPFETVFVEERSKALQGQITSLLIKG